jgi:hypothetical protein
MSIEAMVAVTYAAPPDGARNVSARDVLRVLIALAEHADPEGHGARPSQVTLAEVLGLDRRTVRNALHALELQDRIRATGKAVPRQHGTVYSVRLGTLWEADGLGVNSGVDCPPETASAEPLSGVHSGGGLGRGTQACSARHKPEPEPEDKHNSTICASSLTKAASDRTPTPPTAAQIGERWKLRWMDFVQQACLPVGATRTKDELIGDARVLHRVETDFDAQAAGEVLQAALDDVAVGVPFRYAFDQAVTGPSGYLDTHEYQETRHTWTTEDLWCPFVLDAQGRWWWAQSGEPVLPEEVWGVNPSGQFGRASPAPSAEPASGREWFDHGLDRVAPEPLIDEEADDGW